jgi:hypothetical protein
MFMNVRIAAVALMLAIVGCDRQSAPEAGGSTDAPQLDAPAPESQPSRVFGASNDAARSATGELTVSVTMQLPDAAGADVQEVLALRGANGLAVAAQITGAVSPATQVQGRTLRALLSIPVEEPQVLVYRVTEETKPASGRGLCGADDASFVVVWEPSSPGEPSLKLLGVSGGAPGAASARACPMLEYRRQ